jgi:hypothetical protein
MRSGDDGVASKDGGGGQRQQRGTMTAADDNGMQDWVADYSGEGQEWATRDSGDSRVAMIAAVTEDGSSKQQRRRWTTVAMANDDSGG